MKQILLLGDSIRMGYDKYVRMAYEGEYEVLYPDENCRFAAYITRFLFDWKTKLCCKDVELVHWNAGLWDCLHMTDGEALTPLEVYEVYIERICKMIREYFPNAKVIFATSTPVQEHLFGALKRYNKEIEEYNAAAVGIAESYGAQINDLYALMSSLPVDYHSDLTHFYTKDGTRAITEQVCGKIDSVLGSHAKKLDYDALFGDTKDILGI